MTRAAVDRSFSDTSSRAFSSEASSAIGHAPLAAGCSGGGDGGGEARGVLRVTAIMGWSSSESESNTFKNVAITFRGSIPCTDKTGALRDGGAETARAADCHRSFAESLTALKSRELLFRSPLKLSHWAWGIMLGGGEWRSLRSRELLGRSTLSCDRPLIHEERFDFSTRTASTVRRRARSAICAAN